MTQSHLEKEGSEEQCKATVTDSADKTEVLCQNKRDILIIQQTHQHQQLPSTWHQPTPQSTKTTPIHKSIKHINNFQHKVNKHFEYCKNAKFP